MYTLVEDLFIAGIEFSYTAIIWALSKLMKNPSVMAKAQAEVRQVFKEMKILLKMIETSFHKICD